MILIILLIISSILGAVYWLYMSPHSQILGVFPYHVKTNKKVIALSFDDGPNEPYTSQIVEFLNSRSIKASFFQVGLCVARYPELTKQMAADGHLIGNHSLSHQFSKYIFESRFTHELESSQAIFQRTLGKQPACFRPPWLWRYPQLFKTIQANNLQIVSGDFCHELEVLQLPARFIARRAVAKAKPGAIIIFHDGYDAKGGNRSQTVAAVKLVVNELTRQGYSFVTVDKLLGVPAYH